MMSGALPSSSSFVVIVVVNDGGGGEKVVVHPNDKQGKVHCYCYDIMQGSSLNVGTT